VDNDGNMTIKCWKYWVIRFWIWIWEYFEAFFNIAESGKTEQFLQFSWYLWKNRSYLHENLTRDVSW